MDRILLGHQAVMGEEVIQFLDLKPGKKILDCTVGAGGHAGRILPNILPGGLLVGIDYDSQTLKIAESNLREFKNNFVLVKDNFINFDKILVNLGIDKIDGVVMDLGISSIQLDDALRGLSFKVDGPLDMRVDGNSVVTAGSIVNNASFEELDRILKECGEEPFHRRIAKSIIDSRRRKKITSTLELAEIVLKATPYSRRHRNIHPATRTFMALRIEVNEELDNLKAVLSKIFEFMNLLSRICVISFHSLEDRIVKNSFKEFKQKNIIKILTKKPLTPTYDEIRNNVRSRSAKMRVAEKI